MRQKVDYSNSGRNAAAQYHVRRFNTDPAVDAIAEEVPWKVTRYDRTTKGYAVPTARFGHGYTVVSRSSHDTLPGRLS